MRIDSSYKLSFGVQFSNNNLILPPSKSSEPIVLILKVRNNSNGFNSFQITSAQTIITIPADFVAPHMNPLHF